MHTMNLYPWSGALLAVMLGALAFMNTAQAQDADSLDDLSLEALLNTEVTTASKSAEKLSDAPGVISVVTRDELDRFGGTTLRDILNRVAGLTSTTAYFTDRALISARGDQTRANSGHVLFLIDGRPVREILDGGLSSDVLETFPVNIIEKIEVVKGPGSVLYGSDAFSAVINVITEQAEMTGATVAAFGGPGGAYGASGEAKIQTGDLRVVAAVRHYDKAEWDIPYRRTDNATGDVVTEYVTIPERGTGAFLSADFKGLRFTSGFNQWETQYFIRGNLGQNEWGKGYANLGYGASLSDAWQVDVNLTYAQATLKASGYPFIERESSDFVAEWTNLIQLSGRSRLVFGSLFNRIQGQELYLGGDTPATISDDHRNSVGVYSQIDHRLWDNLKLIGGFQANKVEGIDPDVVPRAGVVWYPAPRINVKALYSQAFRAPRINEVGLNHPALKGNPDLTPEKVGTFDLSVSYQGDHAQAGINVFRSKLTDIIIADRSTMPGLHRNLGEVQFQGVEFEGKYYVNRRLLLTGSMLYQMNTDGNGNENVTPIANFGAKAGISYQAEGFTISLFDAYQGSLDDSYDATLNPDPGAYHMASLHGRINLAQFLNLKGSKDLSLFVQVDNLLDRTVWSPDWGGIAGETIPFNGGRSVYFGINAAL